MNTLRLKDLGRWYSGGTPPRERLEHWDGDVPWISAKDIDSTRLRPATTFITREAAVEHSRMVPAGALLLIVRGMALAHGLPVVETDMPVAFNQDLRALVCAPGIAPRFVYYSLIGHRWRLNAHVDQAAHGTARVNDCIYGERIPVPDRRAQRAVAEFLDRECARIAELSGELSALSASLAAQQSEHVSRQLYGRPLVPLRYRLASIEQGWSPQCEDRLADPGEWGVLKVGCVNYGQFRALEHKRLPDDLEPRPATEIREGDVLMSRANTRELVGSAALVSGTAGRRLMLCDKLYRLSPSPRTNPWFLVIVLCSRGVRDQIEVATTGASGSMQNISQQLIRSLSVPDCDPAEQPTLVEEFHRMAVAYRAAIDETEAIRVDLAEYRDALITEAVTGQLDIARLSETQMDESLDAVSKGERSEVLAS